MKARLIILLFLMTAWPCYADGPGVTTYPAQRVYGPSPRYPDSPVFTLSDKMYIANGTTYIYGSLQSPVIGPGASFDYCGAWLMSAYQDGPIVRGWYHAEAITPGVWCALKTIAYAESYDGGLTFVKPNYPHNQIITAPPIPNLDFDDEGDFYVTRNGDYYYLYFLTSRDVRVHLARSKISDGGKPGTWRKWYQGDFSEPGLGGKSDPIAERWELQVTWVTWSTYLGKWLGLHRRSDGWGLSTSPDGLNWTAVGCTIIKAGFQVWGRDEADKPLVDYLSIIGLDGSSQQAGRDFWVYYMLINEYEDHNSRYLMRRRVTLDGGGGCEMRYSYYLPVVRGE